MELLEELKNSIISQNQKRVKELTEELIKSGMDINIIINAITEALKIVGDRFNNGDLFLPEVIRAANASKAALNLILPKMLERKTDDYKGTIAIGSLGPHDIGKTIVSAALIANGFRVIDMGVNITPEVVEKTLRENEVHILALSILLTSDIEKARIIIERAKKLTNGLRVMVGGAVMNESIASNIKADAYGKNADEAVEIANKLIRGK
ncbi:MAG: cobalamin-dependent protein [Candidatus Methanomethyliaceae archaeon]|nr:cobalamin-dependent protein [Candidatus Methanomethyliaceae archaeon]MDW7971235.1 cobalamin-dependent protein [Nitrososphaerota archaeon]